MKRKFPILLIVGFLAFMASSNMKAQEPLTTINGIVVRACVDKGDTIPYVQLRTLYVYPRRKFKSKREKIKYDKLVRDVKKTLPIAKIINRTIIETYEYLETLPDKKAKKEHIKRVEKGLKEQYTPMMKKLTFSQGKLLIRLIDRECNQSSYELVKAFVGPLKAGFYQTFAALFGASLKKEYDPDNQDRMTEQIVNMVESGQL